MNTQMSTREKADAVRAKNIALIAATASTFAGAAVTSDFWTEPMTQVNSPRYLNSPIHLRCIMQTAYITNVVHLIDENWEFRSITISIAQFSQDKRHEYILSYMRDALHLYGIDLLDEKHMFVTDGGTNFAAVWSHHHQGTR